MQSGTSIYQMMMQGWPVLSVLLLMSIFSVTTIVDRVRTFRLSRANSRAFAANIVKLLDEQGEAAALEYCRRYAQPVAVVAVEILSQPGGREARERALQHALQVQVRLLEAYVPLLGTIASTAPFVGLFGTVIGIIKAFGDIAANTGGGPEVVAAGIAEALITTACGLLVAMPALMAYNYCVHQVQKLADDIDDAMYFVIERLTGGDDRRV